MIVRDVQLFQLLQIKQSKRKRHVKNARTHTHSRQLLQEQKRDNRDLNEIGGARQAALTLRADPLLR